MPSVGMKLELLDAFGRRHHGLISKSKAEELGISRSAWYRALDAQMLEPLHPNVARLWGSPSTLQQRALAAAWAVADNALVSHRTATALWGVPRPDDEPIDILVVDRSRHTVPDGVVVHRPRDRLDLRPIVRERVPVTNPMRTLIDLGAVDHAGVYDALIGMLSSRVASPTAIRSALVRHARKGRHGVSALRQALEQWLSEELPPDSQLEVALASLVDEFGLPPVLFHERVEGYEVDFRIGGTNIILECDGWGAHGLDRDQFEFDRIRNTELTAAGYVIVHFTWRQLSTDRAGVAQRIRNVVATWAPHLVSNATGAHQSRDAGRARPR